jgi:hypothetical protein
MFRRLLWPSSIRCLTTSTSYKHAYNLAQMPPKKSLSTKRKLATEDESEVDVLVPPSVVSKKAKTADNAADGKEDPLPTGNGQPNNKVLPINIVFPQRAENALRIAAWNVTSLASSQKKGIQALVICPRHITTLQVSRITLRQKMRTSSF